MKLADLRKGTSNSQLLIRSTTAKRQKNEHQKNFLESAKKKLKIKSWKDWYQYSSKNIKEIEGSSVLRGTGFSKFITEAIPDHPWNLFDFKNVPRSFWSKKTNHRLFLESIKPKLHIKDWKDWYKITQKDLVDVGANSLLSQYNFSPSRLITSVYPDHTWDLSQFKTVHKHFWKDVKNQKRFLESVKKKLNVKKWEDWYRVTQKDITKAGGYSLLRQYNNSTSTMIRSVFPDHPWNVVEFKRVPNSFWNDTKNQLIFLENVKNQLGIKEWKEWYRIGQKEIIKAGGTGLLGIFGNSPSKLITSVLPQHPWKLYLFQTKRFKWNQEAAKMFLDFVAFQQKVCSPLDWRTISITQIIDSKGGNSLLSQTRSLQNALKLAYPSENWGNLLPLKMSRPQSFIVTILSKYIDRKDIFVNYRHPDLIHTSGTKAELDVWIPSLNLAIEYHGEHHYHQLWEKSQHPSVRKVRDNEKRNLCNEVGIKLVELPYWWDRTETQMIGVIRSVQSDFLSHIEEFEGVRPLTLQETSRTAISKFNIFNLANEWNRIQECSLWGASEKLDGHRSCWNGNEFYSRNQNRLVTPVPLSFLPLKSLLIDGELWNGRKKASETLTFQAFDLLLEN